MKAETLNPALSPEALLAKSKLYIQKALLRKQGLDLDEYQLWASLALELLGKSCLAKVHPSLIADPKHFQSLFAAARVNISTDIKTIGAHTLFERLRHIHKAFDEKTKVFCNGIALRRNAELHSGETPFRSLQSDVWEAQYWRATEIILEAMDSNLDNWLGTTQAETPKEILRHTREAKHQALDVRVLQFRDTFNKLKKVDRERALKDAADRHPYHYTNLFTVFGDTEWAYPCPACGGNAFLAGVQDGEEVLDTYSDGAGSAWESVEKFYTAEQFHCPVCDLFLDGTEEIEYLKIDSAYSDIDEREMEYEPDYGND